MIQASDGKPEKYGFARFCWFVLGFNLLVIVWGAFVRATGAGAGCGSHWPLCNGEVVPHSPTFETVVELGHRLTSGIALVLVIAMLYGAWKRYPAGHRVRSGAVTSLVLTLIEALIGAGLVLLEYVANDASSARGFWVAGHLVNTFLLVGSLTLTAWWAHGGAALDWQRRDAPRFLLAAALGGMLLLGASGAVTALGDTLFPAATFAEGKQMTFSPQAHLFIRLRIWHPFIALVVGCLVTAAAYSCGRGSDNSEARPFAVAAIALFAAQIGLGLANMWFLAPIPLQLAHLLLSDLIWISMVLLTATALAVR